MIFSRVFYGKNYLKKLSVINDHRAPHESLRVKSDAEKRPIGGLNMVHLLYIWSDTKDCER